MEFKDFFKIFFFNIVVFYLLGIERKNFSRSLILVILNEFWNEVLYR